MRAVIVDLSGDYAAALDQNGSIVRIVDAGYAIGQTIELRPVAARRPGLLRRVGAIAAAAMLSLCVCSGTAYAMPYGTVNLDAEPDIEYTINCFDYVLSARGLNQEGELVLESMGRSGVRNRPIDRVIEDTVDQIAQDGYLDREGGDQVAVIAGTKNEAHTQRLEETLNTRVQERIEQDKQTKEEQKKEEEQKQEAKKEKQSPVQAELAPQETPASATDADQSEVPAEETSTPASADEIAQPSGGTDSTPSTTSASSGSQSGSQSGSKDTKKPSGGGQQSAEAETVAESPDKTPEPTEAEAEEPTGTKPEAVPPTDSGSHSSGDSSSGSSGGHSSGDSSSGSSGGNSSGDSSGGSSESHQKEKEAPAEAAEHGHEDEADAPEDES